MEKIKLLVRGVISVVLFSTILFASAGGIHYTQGWIYFSTTMTTAVMSFVALRNKTALLRERSKPGKGAKAWDKRILGLSAIVFIMTLVLAGLDTGRFGWSPRVHWSVYVTGICLTLAGHSVFLTAQRQNDYFSSVVTIRTDGEQTVCDTGLYRVIRHPGYAGMTISLLGLPLLTGSLWSLIPTAIAIILLWTRTALEDNSLKKELRGYVEYTRKIRHKLIPGIW